MQRAVETTTEDSLKFCIATGLFNKYNPTGDYDDNALLGQLQLLEDICELWDIVSHRFGKAHSDDS